MTEGAATRSSERCYPISNGSTKPRVAICWPRNGNMAYVDFMERTWFPLKNEPAEWGEKIMLSTSVPSLPLARNTLAKLALDAHADYLFFIDGDILFDEISPNEGLRRLLASGKSIISGLYTAKTDFGFVYAAWTMDRETRMYKSISKQTLSKAPSQQPVQVDAIGLGCCLIHTDILRKMEKPFFHWDESGEQSEDFYFLEKASNLGHNYKPFVDVGLRLSHIGTMIVDSHGRFRTKHV